MVGQALRPVMTHNRQASDLEELDPVDRTFSESQSDNQVSANDHVGYTQGFFTAGRIFRIWQQGNTYIHKKTVLLIANYNDRSICLPVRSLPSDSVMTQQGDFEDCHMKLIENDDMTPAAGTSAQVKLAPKVKLGEDLWVNIEEAILVLYDVRVCRCGVLNQRRLKTIQRRFYEHLGERMQIHDD